MSIISVKTRGLELKEINDFQDFQGNLKEVTPARLEKLKNNILKNGFIAPIFVWSGHNYILDGHTRIQAVKELLEGGNKLETGTEVPYVEIVASSEKQAAEYILAYSSQYNIISEDGFKEFLTDFDLSVDDFKAEVNIHIDAEDWDKEESGEVKEVEEDDFEAPEDTESIETDIEQGDVIRLGDHVLMCGDSTSTEDVGILMNNDRADLLFTDPPYGVKYSNNMNDKFEMIKNDDQILDFRPVANNFSKENIHWYIWTSQSVYPIWREMFKEKYKNTIIWFKGGGGIGDLKGDYAVDYEMCLFCHNGRKELNNRQGAVWQINKDGASTYVHPTQKPIALAGKAM